MIYMDILRKIEEAKIVGRGGANFPAHLKWKRVAGVKNKQKYVVCNASEGEIGVQKDLYILENHLEDVFHGMVIAMNFLKTKDAYINLNQNYYDKIKDSLIQICKYYSERGYNINIFVEEPSYIGGERSALMEAIEGKRTQPRLKPPSPSIVGLFKKPTLVHNVETLYDVCLVATNRFVGNRFYTICGEVENPGVYNLPAHYTVEQVLLRTNNYPKFKFIAQIGGSASGPVITQKQANKQVAPGCGSIDVIRASTSSRKLLKRWFKFYAKESCGKCTPCREGTYQLYKMIKSLPNNQKIPWMDIMDIAETMKMTSVCGLGKALIIPLESYLQNIVFAKEK